MENARSLAAISDDDLLRRLVDLLRQSRRVESDLVAHIGEAERRRLYAREAFPSMFAYCTQVLRLSEAEAYARITVARASRKHPMLLDMLADGRLHLTGVARLAPHLTAANRSELLERATHKSRRQIEALIADLAPRPDAPALMRKLPERTEPPTPWGPVAVLEEAGAAAPEDAVGDDAGHGAVAVAFAFRSIRPWPCRGPSSPRRTGIPCRVHMP
jgi:hypothetical protein